MRYMIMVRTGMGEAGTLPTEEQFAAMTSYNEEMLRAGVFLQGEGLRPTRAGFRVQLHGDERHITDGPFAESKEVVAGFTMIEVKSPEEALEWVRRWPSPPEDGDYVLEVRRVFEKDELGDTFTPELRAREAAMREEAARNAAGG